MAGCGADCGASSAAGNTGVAGRAARTIIAGRMPTFPNRGCTAWYSPMHKPVNPLGGKLSTGKPYAGEPPVRFGGRRDRGNRSFLHLFLIRPSGTSALVAKGFLKRGSRSSAGPQRRFSPFSEGVAHGVQE